jgi:hypothetical protein
VKAVARGLRFNVDLRHIHTHNNSIYKSFKILHTRIRRVFTKKTEVFVKEELHKNAGKYIGNCGK